MSRYTRPKILKESDILNIDVTCILNGWFGDSSRMYIARSITKKASRLIEVTHNALLKGIEVVKPGNTFERYWRSYTKIC